LTCPFLLDGKFCRIRGERISPNKLEKCINKHWKCPFKKKYFMNEGYRATPEIIWAVEK